MPSFKCLYFEAGCILMINNFGVAVEIKLRQLMTDDNERGGIHPEEIPDGLLAARYDFDFDPYGAQLAGSLLDM